jgi:hypothetical protein
VESADLAERFRAVGAAERQRVAEQMVNRALAAQEPPLAAPADEARLRLLAAKLDASEVEGDFRRARAAAAAQFLCRAAYEDALYEALHARRSLDEAVREALDALS